MKALAPLSRLVLLTAVAAGPAFAADDFAPYVGLGGGVAHYGYDSEMCASDIGGSCELDQNDTGMKIFAGVRLNASQGLVEVAYYDFGSLSGNGVSPILGPVQIEEEQTAVALSMGATPVLADGLEGLLRFGLYSADIEARVDSAVGSGSLSDSSSGLMLGGGIVVHASDTAALRLEYEHFLDAGDSETDLGIATAAIVLSF
ncbi:MAG TPA: outer membrane beta-barrel protein [Moraxellaceae bacterium]|nr:outer membrane beta-barrel protein [Moraxellaceae bacterium]